MQIAPAGDERHDSLARGDFDHHVNSIAHNGSNRNDTADGEDDIISDDPKLANPLSITAVPKYMSSSKGLKCKHSTHVLVT
jgi:hypothetical protein